MAKQFVNLDAMIFRADFEEDTASHPIRTKLNELRLIDLDPHRGVLWRSFRKPDFQRETSAWTPDNVAEFVESFIKEEFLPALIMWRNPETSNVFVIDGAHRLSALIAWVLDDYGDGERSRKFYENKIPSDQIAAAEKTKALIESGVGSYAALRDAATSDDPLLVKRVLDADSIPIEVQAVQGDAEKAELAFYSINLKAVAIDATEALLIQSRKKPSAMAARAIRRQSTGHQYWKDFPQLTRDKIRKTAKLIHDALYVPEPDPKVDREDLAIAGPSSAGDSLTLIYNLGAIANNATPLLKKLKNKEFPIYKSRGRSDDEEEDDPDGKLTLNYLSGIQNITTRFIGREPKSLGLHPVVYSYALTGRFQPPAFLATAGLLMGLGNDTTKLVEFTQVRARFEEYLLRHRSFVNQTVSKYGSQLKSYDRLLGYYHEVLRLIKDGLSFDEVTAALLLPISDYRYLKDRSDELTTMTSGFSSAVKAVAFYRKALEGSIRCVICHARISPRSISHHHGLDVKYGGGGNPDNDYLVHVFCNNTYIEQGHPPIPPLPENL